MAYYNVIWILLIVLFRGNEKDSHGVYYITLLLQIPSLSIKNLSTLTIYATVPTVSLVWSQSNI